MMRRSRLALATAIPRHAWDPTRHNPNWADSYGTEIADRRVWPAKKWSIGLEPRTPNDWLNFSKRNLSYAYNAAMRSCSTFPEMIRYYKEMKQRGVKVDLDTMNTLLTRAARYEKIQVPDIFALFDEMIELGARPDLASAETLHTVWDHSAGEDPVWRELRRERLLELYNSLATTEIEQYGDNDLPHLLAAQMKRYRENARSLGASLNPTVYKQYLATITSFPMLLTELNNYLWDLVPPEHEAIDDPTLRIRVPVVGSALKRPPLTSETDTSSVSLLNFQDYEVCDVFLTAVERIVDHSLGLRTQNQQRAAALSLQVLLSTTRVLVTSDLLAQLMDIVKFSPLDESRDRDATRLLATAVRAGSSKKDDHVRRTWARLAIPCDARVVARYIAARDPWSPTRFAPQGTTFALFAAGDVATVDPAAPKDESEVLKEEGGNASEKKQQLLRTALDVETRWNDVRTLIQNTGALTNSDQSADHRVEVFTGLASFIRHMFTNHRLHAGSEETVTSFASGMNMEVCRAVFSCLQTAKRELDTFCNDNAGAEPELECWESMMTVLRGMMDFYVLQKKSQRGGSGSAISQDEDAFFLSVAELRSQMIEESKTRFGGRFRMLWLQEA